MNFRDAYIMYGIATIMILTSLAMLVICAGAEFWFGIAASVVALGASLFSFKSIRSVTYKQAVRKTLPSFWGGN